MKRLLTCILIFCFSLPSYALGTSPSLEAQMTRQASIDKKNAIEAKKLENKRRLAEIRARKNTTPQKTSIASVKSESIAKTPATIVSQPIVTTPPKESSGTKNTSQVSVSASQLPIAGVDMNRVRSAWLSWYNDTRASRGLGAYSYDGRLDSTAHDWNTVFAASRGTNYHERNPGDGYYKYSVIDAWFKARGVNPPIIAGVNHSENVSYGTYSCSDSDCTDELISAIQSSYRFFINSSVHAKSVYQPNFTKIGLDVIVVPSERRYYVTVHYMTR